MPTINLFRKPLDRKMLLTAEGWLPKIQINWGISGQLTNEKMFWEFAGIKYSPNPVVIDRICDVNDPEIEMKVEHFLEQSLGILKTFLGELQEFEGALETDKFKIYNEIIELLDQDEYEE